MTTTQWHNCYGEPWGADIVKQSTSHPAKFSRKLILTIYAHALSEGWIRRGDTVVDPFGGVALGGFGAMLNGLNWVGCELEEKFAKLGNENIALWKRRYGTLGGSAMLLNGDSRKLSSTLQSAAASISSPPFVQTAGGAKGINVHGYGMEGDKVGERTYQALGGDRAPGNLEVLPEGNLDLALSSPPYASISTGAGGLNTKPAKKPGQQSGRSAKAASQDTDQKYGQTAGQLAALPDTGMDAALSSPPYENCLSSERNGIDWSKVKKDYPGRVMHEERIALADEHHNERRYSAEGKNLGNQSGDTFWTAARTIVEQTFAVLRPGAHAIWVTKNYVKKRQEIDFNGNWQRLCEAVGFKTVCIHRAMLVENCGTNLLLEGGEHTETRQRKSFFRRLAESKGSPRIDYECVTCMVRL